MQSNNIFRILSLCTLACTNVLFSYSDDGTSSEHFGSDRSPVDLAVSPDGKWIATANEISGSVSLVRVSDARVVSEIKVGDHPAAVRFLPNAPVVAVTCMWSGEVVLAEVSGDELSITGRLKVGGQPCGIDITSDGKTAFVGLVASQQVAELDLMQLRVRRRIDVGKWPRYLTLSNDDSRLAVGATGDSEIEVYDVATGRELYDEPLSSGINLGHMTTTKDDVYAYFTWMVYRSNPINVGNIRRGWVLASRIGRVRLDGSSYREAISLDVPGLAVADPHGIAIDSQGRRLIATASGTQELLMYRLTDLPFVATGGPGDLIDKRLESDRDRFSRVNLGGRPMGVQFSNDDRTAFVANYLRDSIQFVDVEKGIVSQEVQLGGQAEDTLARRGREIFFDGRRSLDQWYSCHTCHQNGGTNSRPMDTHNDGSELTFKNVIPLQHVHRTKPWTWHGWQEDLDEAMHKSITSTMQGRAPSSRDKQALVAYLKTIKSPPNPFRRHDGLLTKAAQRGKEVFNSEKAACAQCHSGPYFTDGAVHDVGLGSKNDRYDGYNTPSLRDLYQKTRWLHSGRAKTLESLLTDFHSPEKVSGSGKLSESEVSDLIAYLRSL